MSGIRIDVTANTTGAVTGLEQVRKATQRTGKAIDTASSALKKHSGQYNSTAVATNKFAKGAMQQAGYQVGDFVVQVQNGTNWLQAFGQQGAQMAGVFGPLGAVVGAGIAIFSSLAIIYQKSTGAGRDYADVVSDLTKSIDLYRQSAVLASQSSSDLSAKYGEAAGQARSLFEAQESLRRLASIDVLAESVVALRDEFGSFGAVSREQLESAQAAFLDLGESINQAFKLSDSESNKANRALDIYNSTVRDLQTVLGSSRDDAFNLAKELTDLATADGPEQIAVELEQVRSLFTDIVGGIDSANESQRTLLEKLIESSIAALNLNTEISNTDESFGDAAIAAGSLLKVYRQYYRARITGAAQIAAAEKAEIQSTLSAYRSYYQSRIAGSIMANEAETKATETANSNILAAYRQYGKSRVAAAWIASTEIAKIEENITIPDVSGPLRTVADTIDNVVTPAMERLKSVQESVSSAIEDGMMSMVDGTKSVKEAFKSMASAIIKDLYRIFVVKKITGFIEGAIGGLSGASSAPATSIRPVARSFAGGGYTGNGARAGGLDGKGGYMAMVHPRETVVDHTKGGGTGGVTIIQNNTFGNGVSRAEIQGMLPKIVEASKAAVLDARRRGGSYAGAF